MATSWPFSLRHRSRRSKGNRRHVWMALVSRSKALPRTVQDPRETLGRWVVGEWWALVPGYPQFPHIAAVPPHYPEFRSGCAGGLSCCPPRTSHGCQYFVVLARSLLPLARHHCCTHVASVASLVAAALAACCLFAGTPLLAQEPAVVAQAPAEELQELEREPGSIDCCSDPDPRASALARRR